MVMESTQVPVGAKRPQHELFKFQALKTKMCKFYAVNQCKYGDQCAFAHGSEKLEQMPDLRKTSMCKDWKHGTCPLQSFECPFAHGRNELRRTEAYMHKANRLKDINLFDNTKLEASGFGNRNLFDNNLEANGVGHHNLSGSTKLDHNSFYNTKGEVDPFEDLSALSTSSGEEPIDAEPIKVGTMDSLTSISTRCSSTMSINMEPVKVETAPSLQRYGGPSVTLYNLPFKYSKKMLTDEIKDLGFDIPRDIFHIHLPVAVNTQMNYGHCLIVFTKTHALNAFMDVFQGRVLRHFKSEQKAVMVISQSSHGFDVRPPSNANANHFKGMEVTRLSEVRMDQFIWERNPAARTPECRACTGCGHINMVIDHRFCQWCGCSFRNASSSVAKDRVGESFQ